MKASLPLGLIAACCLLPTVLGQFNWATFTNAAAPQAGKVSFRPVHLITYFVSLVLDPSR